MQTTYERMNNLESKVDKILLHLEPVEKEEPNLEELIDSKFKDLSDVIKSGLSVIKENLTTEEEPELDNSKFNKDRNIYFSGLSVVFLILAIGFFYTNSILFIIPSGFFLAVLGVLFWINVDWKLTPGDSFAKISKNPIALSIVLFAISVFFAVGVFVAQQYVPDSFRNEASQKLDERLINIEKIINQQPEDKKQVPEASENDDEPIRNDRVPNR